MAIKESRVIKITHSHVELDFGYLAEEGKLILKELTENRDILEQYCKAYPVSIDHKDIHGTGQEGERTVYSVEFEGEVSDQQVDALLAYLKQRLQRLTMLKDDLNILSAASKKKAAEK